MSKDIVVSKEYAAAVERIRALLGKWLETGVELFLELREIELSGVWRGLHAQFADFLSAEFPNALGLNRYANVIQAIDLYGAERVRSVGVDSCHAMLTPSLVQNKDLRTELDATIDKHIESNGCAPPPVELRRIVRGIVGERAPLSRASRDLRRDSALVLENAELRRRVRELEGQVRRLTAERDRLIRRSAKPQRKSATPSKSRRPTKRR